VLVGLIRANPIIVSIAANILIYGMAAWLTGNQTVYGPTDSSELFLRQVIAGVPVEFIVFLALIALGQFILTYTVFGRHLLLVGSGSQAADALRLPVGPTISLAYVWAGLFTTVSGILLAVPAATNRKLSDRQRLALDALADCAADRGQSPPQGFGLPNGLVAATLDQWRDELRSRGVLDPDAKNPREDFRRVRNSLHARKLIGVRDNFVWRT
jgi:predicted ABC-type sugar transport system permease subunit